MKSRQFKLLVCFISVTTVGCSLIPSNNPTSQLAGDCALLMNKLGAPFAYNSNNRLNDYYELKKDMDNCLSNAREKLAGEGVLIQ